MDHLDRLKRAAPGRRLVSGSLRKGVYVVPNLITTAGLFAGFYSVIASFRGDFQIAAIAIIVANVLDSLDGLVARLTKTTTRFGIQYDSLCDLVAFGVAPGILVYRWALEPWGTVGWLAASLFVTAGALRLARFNAHYDNFEKRHFIGLPIPAAAEMIVATVLLYYYFGGVGMAHRHLIVLVMVYALAGLMISNFRYFSFKDVQIHRRQPFGVLVAIILLLTFLTAEPQLFLFSGFLIYAASGPGRWLLVRSRRLLKRGPAGDALTSPHNSSTVDRP